MGKKILVADDEPDIVKMLSMRLKAHGYEVIAAFDGLQAVREAYKERPDLIVRLPRLFSTTSRDTKEKSFGKTKLLPRIRLLESGQGK